MISAGAGGQIDYNPLAGYFGQNPRSFMAQRTGGVSDESGPKEQWNG